MTRSLAARMLRLVGLTMVLSGAVAYMAGSSLLEKSTGLSTDAALSDALATGRDGLVHWHKERQLWAARAIEQCAASSDWPHCLPEDAAVQELGTRGVVMAALADHHWEDASHYVLARQGAAGVEQYRIGLAWEDVQPRFAAISEALKTRAHLEELWPTLIRSLQVVFALALALASACGLIVLWWLMHRMAKRVRTLTSYAASLASGQQLQAPPETIGGDELGVLAATMEGMARSLAEATRQLVFQEKMASWQLVARKMAHEIKNPLTPISLVGEQLARCQSRVSPEVAAVLAESSRILREETGFLTRMVREFTDFARLPVPQKQPCDLIELVRDFARRSGELEGLQIDFATSIDCAPVAVDRGMIVQVLRNLLLNSQRARCDASLHLTLSATVGGYALDFQDDGPGVPESMRDVLFDAYVTTRSTGEAEKGMGLGLTISRKIAHEHAGTLVLLPTPAGAGACFRLELPARTASEPTRPTRVRMKKGSHEPLPATP